MPSSIAELNPSMPSPSTELNPSDIPPSITELNSPDMPLSIRDPLDRPSCVMDPNRTETPSFIRKLNPTTMSSSGTELKPYDRPSSITELNLPGTPLSITDPSPPDSLSPIMEPNRAETLVFIREPNPTAMPSSTTELNLPDILSSTTELNLPDISSVTEPSARDMPSSITKLNPSDVSLSFITEQITSDISPNVERNSPNTELLITDVPTSFIEFNSPDIPPSITERISLDISQSIRQPIPLEIPQSITQLSSSDIPMSIAEHSPDIVSSITDVSPSVTEMSISDISLTDVSHDRQPPITELPHDTHPSLTEPNLDRLPSILEFCLDERLAVQEFGHNTEPNIAQLIPHSAEVTMHNELRSFVELGHDTHPVITEMSHSRQPSVAELSHDGPPSTISGELGPDRPLSISGLKSDGPMTNKSTKNEESKAGHLGPPFVTEMRANDSRQESTCSPNKSFQPLGTTESTPASFLELDHHDVTQKNCTDSVFQYNLFERIPSTRGRSCPAFEEFDHGDESHFGSQITGCDGEVFVPHLRNSGRTPSRRNRNSEIVERNCGDEIATATNKTGCDGSSFDPQFNPLERVPSSRQRHYEILEGLSCHDEQAIAASEAGCSGSSVHLQFNSLERKPSKRERNSEIHEELGSYNEPAITTNRSGSDCLPHITQSSRLERIPSISERNVELLEEMSCRDDLAISSNKTYSDDSPSTSQFNWSQVVPSSSESSDIFGYHPELGLATHCNESASLAQFDRLDRTPSRREISHYDPESSSSSTQTHCASQQDLLHRTQNISEAAVVGSVQNLNGAGRSIQPRPHSACATSSGEGEARASAQRMRRDRDGQEAAKQEQRPTSGTWLRASMRRVRQLPLPPLATPETVLDILASNSRRPNSAPGGGQRTRRDFPRRYSSYSAATIHSSTTNLTQAAEPVAVESPSSDEDLSSGSENTGPEPSLEQNPDTRPGSESDTESNSPLGSWPHNLSSMLASLGCTLGLFNISRFAILSIHFGANFIIQFLFLTLVMGIPLYTLHACLGQCLGAGVMDMWKISPIFQGIGIALLVSQALIGVYSIVGVSWMFIYFRDSFITKQDRYRWAEPYEPYREVTSNTSWRLEETVPDYFSGIVLQRYNLRTPDSSFGHLKFQVAFNLAVVWMIVFVSLSKGLRSYGKVVYVFSLFPVFGTLVLCTKMLGLTPTNTTHQVFPQTVWSEFFLNTKCWIAATMEVFFTWGLLGAAAMQIASHNRHKRLLNRDTSLVIVLTLAVLLLAAFLANTCVTILHSQGFTYLPSSFEYLSTYSFLQSSAAPLPPALASTPIRYMTHTTLIAGNRVTVPGVDSHRQSGYQVLRLATELVPSTLALLGADAVSPFWAVLFYFVLILFGIAQQLCIWHCVITGVMAINATTLKSWETTITFFSCACGFILGLPMTTELGIFVVYFMDYCVGCSWWLMLLYLLEIIAVFVVRGRPYSGETIVATLLSRSAGCLQTWAAPMLVFTWNVILPIALVVLCIASFKNGQFRDLYNWQSQSYDYWPVWTREVGCFLQILPIVIVPLVCVVQSFRYLSDGPPDILDRIQLLYRPPVTRQDPEEVPNSPTNSGSSVPAVTITPAPETTVTGNFEDPPPKYTPPPSYTAATGARIAKLLRRSFRRSMRRLTGALSDNNNADTLRNTLSPPPDYAAVLVEMNQASQNHNEPDSSAGTSRFLVTPTQESFSAPNTIARSSRSSTMTAADVAQILRSSLRSSIQRRRTGERLVETATPIHHDLDTQHDTELSSSSKLDENTSVI